MEDSRKDSRSRIEPLDQEAFEQRLRSAARGLFPDRVMDDMEIRHLVRVVTECPLLLPDVYSEERIVRIMQPNRGLIARWFDRLVESEIPRDETVTRLKQLPDQARLVGDKALFDLGFQRHRRVRGYDLSELGARAYRAAGEVLELLAEDRRLQDYFRQNKLLMLPLEEEVVFLRQCSKRFRLYADLLQYTCAADADDAGPATIDEIAARVPLMAAAAQALEQAEDEPIELRSSDDDDAYVAAARGRTSADAALSRERLLSTYERILLFSALDLDRLKGALKSTVIDQETAVEALCDDFTLFAAGTRDQRKPPAYFLVGPTGVGKNHLVESLRRLLEGVWSIEVPILTIEGPNYTYPSDINELRGATRGFIRSDEDGILTSFHQKSGSSPLGVVLVDEVEKAHPHLLTFFLSILDRGTTTDNRGDVLNFANCLFFFTSNLGYSEQQQGSAPIGYGDEGTQRSAADRVVRRGLKGSLTPEFVNRVRMIHFNRLGRDSAERILDLELERIAKRYREVHGLELILDATAREELIERGFSPMYGARHLASTLDAVCNVEIAKRIRRDDSSESSNRESLIEWLREMRGGERPFTADEVRRKVFEASRAKLDYTRLRIVFDGDEFDYVAEAGE